MSSPSRSCLRVAEQKDRAEPFDVEEVVQEMPRNQRLTLWGKLGSLLQDVLLELPPERWAEDLQECMEVESAADPVSFCTVVTLTLIFCCFDSS